MPDLSSVFFSGLSEENKKVKEEIEFLEGQDVPKGFTFILMRISPCLSHGFAV